MADIYEQHRAAFSKVAAWVIMKGDHRVATIAIKYPRDGAGKLYSYVHWLGNEIVRGRASGYGYDKGSAAVSHAASKMWKDQGIHKAAPDSDVARFTAAIVPDDGVYWYDRLHRAGFQVWQAV